jgi:eukaryotic-like serine/threonine-protein kinase
MSKRMTPERWARVEELYHEALEREPGARGAYLAEACAGDDRLRAEVESLIASQEREGSFMDSPVVRIADVPPRTEPELTAGELLGSYQILGALGEGGMGVVYLARDAKLGRKVALKLLPSYLKKDKDRLRRLRREAQAASALNHPNILTIYEVGEAEQGTYIASEYVDGETLRGRMKAGLNLSGAVDVAVQVASALDAAHSAGIIHRDIKPENVMVRRDGYVKVLDFGLAKLVEGRAAAAGTEPPTRSLVGTQPGMVMGTVRYMSPEQARGVEVDARTDIFSLGVVLYEIIAGRAPFEGETASDLIAAILKEEPAPLAQNTPEVPEQLQRIIGKALRKDKEQRYQSVRDLLADLKELKEGLEMESRLRNFAYPAVSRNALRTNGGQAETQTAGGQTVSAVGAQAAPVLSSAEYIVSGMKRHKTGTAAALVVLLISAAAIGYALYRFTGQPNLKASSPGIKLIGLTNGGKASNAAISPDGRHVAYVTSDAGQQSLWVRQVPTNGNVQIVAPSAASYWGLTFSRDGNYLYYFSQGKGDPEPALYQMPALGGAPKKLIEGVVNTNGAGPVTLSPDGQRLAFVREYPTGESAVVIAQADGTGERRVASRQGKAYFSAAAWSPDGSRIACAGGGRNENGSAYGDLIEVAVEGGPEKPIGGQGWNWIGDIGWLPDGGALLITAATYQAGDSIDIWHVSYPDGAPRKVTADLNAYSGLSLSSDSGILVTTHRAEIKNIWTQPGGDAAGARQITSGAGTSDGHTGIDWTPDGKIVYLSLASGRPDIWVMDADGGNKKQVTVDLASNNYGLSVSPDGRHIVFVSDRAGKPNVWRVDADGGNAKQLTDGGGEFNPVFQPDGQWVHYVTYISGLPARYRVPADGGSPGPIPGPHPDVLGVSPDGSLAAFIPSGVQGRGKRISVGPSGGG